jgi:molybdopterin biosynthesis enzyme
MHTRFESYAAAAAAIQQEAVMAAAKYPPFNSTHEGYAVVLEELDEAWAEIKANNRDLAIQEMIQVGAMALRFIAEMSRPSI